MRALLPGAVEPLHLEVLLETTVFFDGNTGASGRPIGADRHLLGFS
jgi:hypothetical protein